VRRFALLALAALAATPAAVPAHADDSVAGIHPAGCDVAFTATADDTLRVCDYVPISTAATLAIFGSGTGKVAYVDCLTTHSPHITSGAVRIAQTPGDLCTLHLEIASGSASASSDSRIPL
jgi:hypothetical protein